MLDWIAAQDETRPVLIYSSADPDEVRRVQDALGREHAGESVERALAAVARALTERGFTRLIVAGGETSGAVVARSTSRRSRSGPRSTPACRGRAPSREPTSRSP